VELLFHKQMWNQDLTGLMTYALEEEFKRYSSEGKIRKLLQNERDGAYPTVAKLTQLIDADTRLVVVDAGICAAIKEGERVDRKALLTNSVQLWSTRIQQLALNKIGFGEELYEWGYDYDGEFLGIMKGVLARVASDRRGFDII
jgi:hypothetical protein